MSETKDQEGQHSQQGGEGLAHPHNPSMDQVEWITLRDMFAEGAMQAYLTCPTEDGDRARRDPAKAAAWAYENADAMLAERGKKR